MSNLGKQITELLMDSGKSAPTITHALKSLGNGSMQKGLARMSNYLVDDATAKGLTRGRLEGGLVVFSSAAFICFIYHRRATLFRNQEGEKILSALEASSNCTANTECSANSIEDTSISNKPDLQ